MIETIVFLPLLASFIAGGPLRTKANWKAQYVTSSFLLISAICSAIILYRVAIGGNILHVSLLPWIESGLFSVTWSLYVDSLTAIMLVVVTFVSALVHIFSIGYMEEDPHIPRFMSYLSLFTFFMLLLITSDNFLQLYVGWEGVGLCSYLLIGFWFKKPSANRAAMKAFIVNRVGDFGFALGILMIYLLFGTLDFATVFGQAAALSTKTITLLGMEVHALTLLCGLLFIGCMGKSAQFGLHTWLPDAMEGPTPVSALIHAATMVTAGVFLVARCSPLFEYAPIILAVITLVGGFTAFFAATIGLTQFDIKRVIAYSTCSQLGYMFFACGVSAYSAGIFHLFTHAFFKALLFLAAGSVIHALSHEQDMRKMGGIWKKIPVTYALMWVGSLALAGIYPFAGFFSKDIILESAYAAHSQVGMIAFWFGIAAAFMTAFYSWRLLILTFHGEPRMSKEVYSKVHESPKVILLPLIVLAIGAITAGYVGSHVWHIAEAPSPFLKDAIFVLEGHNALRDAHHVPLWVKYLPLIMGASGILMAYLFYMWFPVMPAMVAKLFEPLYHLFLRKWYIDELYDWMFVRSTKRLGTFLWQVIDIRVIDDMGPNGATKISQLVAWGMSKYQTGYLYHYAFVMLIGLAALLAWFLVGWY